MLAMFEKMQFDRHIVLSAGQYEFDAVLHGHGVVIHAVNEEAGWGLRGDLLLIAEEVDQGGIGIVAQEILA